MLLYLHNPHRDKKGWTQLRTLTKIENTRKYQSELKNTITEMKKKLEGINSRLDDKEEQRSGLEDRIVKIIQDEQQKEKNSKMRIV